jgi:putative oxidoreductase
MSDSFGTRWSPQMLSVLRIVAAFLFLQHGLTKLFGFPGHQPANFSLFTIEPGLAGVIETFGSLALLFGFYSRLAAFIMSGEMAVAYWAAHVPNGWSRAGAMGLIPYNNNGNLAILYCFVFLYIALAGPGPWSIDAARGDRSSRTAPA